MHPDQPPDIVPLAVDPSWEELGAIMRPLDDRIFSAFRLPPAAVRGESEQSAVSRMASGSFETTMTVHWTPAGLDWLWDQWSLATFGVTLDDLVAYLESRRFMRLGGPLASWYRDRPGWRLADAIEAERN